MLSIQKLLLVTIAQAFVISSVCCIASTEFPERTSEDLHRIEGIPFIAKKPDFGGEACMAMCLRKYGWKVDQDFVFDQSDLDPVLGRGCNTTELVQAAKQIGINPGQVWIPHDQTRADIEFANHWRDLKRDLQNDVPWIVCLQKDSGQKFLLLVGFDELKKQVVFHDPGRVDGDYKSMSVVEFRQRWVLSDQANQEFLVKIRVPRPTNSAVEVSGGFTNADFAQHIRDLKDRLPGNDFKIVIEKPFVVIGDEDLAVVKRRATDTVGWATKRLKDVYFSKDPNKILDIWLFKDKTSYERNTKRLIGRKPTTPYGFYSSYHKVLIMNISTGGGTLVHEIVHPFIESNFEDCPSWFNEGFASLYEQCRDNDGRIWGSTNWRLRGLQLAIRDGRVPDFEELCATTRDQFYDEDPGTNYAQARYLCYYLQQEGLLTDFYETFRDNVKLDPTGIDSLKHVLGRSDLAEFKKDWESYVLRLRF